MVKRWPRYLDWKVKGQLVSFAFCSSNHSFLLLFLFLSHRPRPFSPVTFRLSLPLHHLPIPLSPPFLATLPSPFFSPSFLLYLFTLPPFSSLYPVLILPCYSSVLFPSSLSCLPLPPTLFPYSFAYKFPWRINFLFLWPGFTSWAGCHICR